MLQIFRTDNPLFGPGLKLGQRLCYVNAMMHFLFAIPRLVFLASPLAYLLLDQNIIAASPLAIAAYAGPHIFHAVATNSRMQGNARHSFWSEIYETVMAPFLVRLTIVTLLSPKRGKFNVTDKGGLLKAGYFDMRAVYPNIILACILGAGWLIGVGRISDASDAAGLSGADPEHVLDHAEPADRRRRFGRGAGDATGANPGAGARGAAGDGVPAGWTGIDRHHARAVARR